MVADDGVVPPLCTIHARSGIKSPRGKGRDDAKDKDKSKSSRKRNTSVDMTEVDTSDNGWSCNPRCAWLVAGVCVS